jgi:hypothetical protein
MDLEFTHGLRGELYQANGLDSTLTESVPARFFSNQRAQLLAESRLVFTVGAGLHAHDGWSQVQARTVRSI